MFLVVIIALLWLLHRATRLLKIPAPALIHVLGIDIPDTPKIVIDSISTNSVLLHWPPPDRGAVLKYIIEVNGRKICEVDRTDYCITLKNLLCDTCYAIKIVAVNPSNYRSRAAKVLVHTLKDDDDTLPVYPGLLASNSSSTNLGSLALAESNGSLNGNLSPNGELGAVTAGAGAVVNGGMAGGVGSSIAEDMTSAVSTSAAGVSNVSSSAISTGHGSGASSTGTTTSANRLRASSRNTLTNRASNSSFRNQSEKSAYSIESLTHEVESVQIEINELLAQAAHGEEEFQAAEKELLDELEQLKSRKKSLDQQRSHIKSEMKSIEDSKRSLEAQKAKVDSRYKKILDEFTKRNATREKWAADIQQAQSKLVTVESSLEMIDEKGHETVEELEAAIQEKQEQLTALEEELKTVASSARKWEFRKTATVEQIQNIQKKTDSVTGLVKEDAIDELMANPDIDDDVKNRLKAEIDKDKELEDDWQKIQKNLEVRYLTASEQYREAHASHNSAASAIQQQRQLQMQQQQQQPGLNPINGTKAVVDSVNAAIAQKGKKKNRRKSNKNLQVPFSVNSTGVTASGTPYDLVGSNTSPSPSLHSSTTNEFYAPSLQSTGIPGTGVITQTASGLDATPLLANSYLNSTGTNASSSITAFPSIPHSRLSSDLTNEPVDDIENPMSPSVDMLLPSNLFGTDDLTDSFAAIINDLPRTNQRPSALMLAEAFGTGNRPPSFDSSTSPKPSLLSLQEGAPSSPAVAPASPQDSYGAFSAFTAPSLGMAGGYNGSVHSLVDDDTQKKQPQNTAKKFSSMFFFSKPKRDGEPDELDLEGMANTSLGANNSILSGTSRDVAPFLDVGPIGTRPRAGSYNSAHSLGISSITGSTQGSSFFNPWNDVPGNALSPTTSGSGIIPQVSQSSMPVTVASNPQLSPDTISTTPSTIATPLFSETPFTPTTTKSKGFAGSSMWSVFNRDRERARTSSGLKNDISMLDSTTAESPTMSASPSSSWPDMPMLLVSNSHESGLASVASHVSNGAASRNSAASTHTNNTGGPLSSSGGNKFSKSFAELFTSSNKEQSSPQQPPRSRSESKSIAQLFGAKSDSKSEPKTDELDQQLSASVESKESLSKESILQKSMRTFSTSRKGSASSSKFVRRLSIFGKKGEPRDLSDSEDIPEQTILEDSEGVTED
ncbi:hypothetical protein AWJ20_450 [Sugiyamaella lignohabitans]|uniref:Fibronectin type-III domain-containing protein n=1 Tax=Sugiyamaella lignohabitans TaxID=796027 RepID=A0A167CWZ3_9ASCO|nr:uncharacterized protein AWJ20_450 [Sugiyamaella lignohabitans]ANB12206.1 hypothetical protein AWJ20_450 [Sugiyamaella lignohabitans]